MNNEVRRANTFFPLVFCIKGFLRHIKYEKPTIISDLQHALPNESLSHLKASITIPNKNLISFKLRLSNKAHKTHLAITTVTNSKETPELFISKKNDALKRFYAIQRRTRTPELSHVRQPLNQRSIKKGEKYESFVDALRVSLVGSRWRSPPFQSGRAADRFIFPCNIRTRGFHGPW